MLTEQVTVVFSYTVLWNGCVYKVQVLQQMWSHGRQLTTSRTACLLISSRQCYRISLNGGNLVLRML